MFNTKVERNSQDCPSHGVWVDGVGGGGGRGGHLPKKMDHILSNSVLGQIDMRVYHLE